MAKEPGISIVKAMLIGFSVSFTATGALLLIAGILSLMLQLE